MRRRGQSLLKRDYIHCTRLQLRRETFESLNRFLVELLRNLKLTNLLAHNKYIYIKLKTIHLRSL